MSGRRWRRYACIWAGGFIAAFLARTMLDWLLDLPTWADVIASLLIGLLAGIYVDFEFALHEDRPGKTRS